MPREMTPRGAEVLDEYPVRLRGVHFFRAISNAVGTELEILDAELDRLQRNVIPSTSDDLLYVYEVLLGLSVNNPALTIAERRQAVIAWMSRMVTGHSTADFKHSADIAIGTGWSYQAHDPRDATSPPPDHLIVRLPFESGSARANLAEALLADIVDATIILEVTYHSGFILDASNLDEDTL